KLLPSAHAVEREYRVIQALPAGGFPVARPHALCEDDSVLGTAFYVMDFVEGRVLWDQSLPGMTRAQRFDIWDELNRVIARLHTFDYRAVGLEGFGKPGNYIERQILRWTKQYQASATERIEAMDNLIAWLPANIPPETGTAVGLLSRVQPVPDGRDPAGDPEARGRRHGGERARARRRHARAADGRAGLGAGRKDPEESSVNFDYTPKVQELRKKLFAFMDEHVYPNERRWHEHARSERRWEPVPVI